MHTHTHTKNQLIWCTHHLTLTAIHRALFALGTFDKSSGVDAPVLSCWSTLTAEQKMRFGREVDEERLHRAQEPTHTPPTSLQPAPLRVYVSVRKPIRSPSLAVVWRVIGGFPYKLDIRLKLLLWAFRFKCLCSS